MVHYRIHIRFQIVYVTFHSFQKKREREWAFITLLGVFSPFIVIILGNCFQNPTTLLLYYSLFWWNQRRMN